MSGATRTRSMSAEEESEARPVLGPAGNKARSPSITRKPASKPLRKLERAETGKKEEKKKESSPVHDSPPLVSSLSAPSSLLRRQELLLRSNLSLNASCSSDASTDSFCSRASTGRIGRPSFTNRRRQGVPRAEKIASKLEKIVPDGDAKAPPEFLQGKRRCAWVTPNTDPGYVAFHDEEWGVPVHDDRKLFELLVLSGALAELTWPTILSKRHIFREVFVDFDLVAVSKLNEKKIIAPGSTASSLLSEPKLRAIIENARQILKIIEEFGSFDKYCWGFVNHKPITSRFRYPRQVPVKTPKAEVISKDLVKRGFRSVGPTVIYTFMQVAGLTNDHLITCYRFDECATAITATATASSNDEVCATKDNNNNNDCKEVKKNDEDVDFELSISVDGLSFSSS
ncbi:uncharacterized protein A4U43_C05F17590 [Asparagus officinalis]|uniref:Uncharacterized protein n=1 Tax=Asparagus officinalis TaxID=4686 RepID=A0A5P1EUV5_ASPOF|nr:uncharacterized protein LOC109843993 [Asparagus officinalis]ONK68937.1 uncharacterized protein A4U43_C05F17590 [Asparagus officinalis]